MNTIYKHSLSKKIYIIFLAILLILTFNMITTNKGEASMNNTTNNKIFVKKVFKTLFDNKKDNISYIPTFFSKNYVQYVNGKKINYHEFVQHIKALSSHLKSIHITFKYVVAQEDKVATVHIVKGQKKDGSFFKFQVNALIVIKDGKIILIDELTHQLAGNKEDKNLGSTTKIK